MVHGKGATGGAGVTNREARNGRSGLDPKTFPKRGAPRSERRIDRRGARQGGVPTVLSRGGNVQEEPTPGDEPGLHGGQGGGSNEEAVCGVGVREERSARLIAEDEREEQHEPPPRQAGEPRDQERRRER